MRDPTNQKGASLQPATRRRLIVLSSVVLLTVLAAAWGAHARRVWYDPDARSPWDEPGIRFEPTFIGLLVQLAIVPLVLLNLFSNTLIFRRVITGQIVPGDIRKVLGYLVLIQLLTLVIGVGLARLGGFPANTGYAVIVPLVVVSGGFLGGAELGFRMGLTGLLMRSTHTVIMMSPFLLGPIVEAWYSQGVAGVLRIPWAHLLGAFTVAQTWAIPTVWAGIVTGLIANTLGESRFRPLPAFLLGVGVGLGDNILLWLSGEVLTQALIVPGTLLVGLTTVVISLSVRGVMGKVARQEAAAAELARSQAELRALRAQINPQFLFNALNTIRFFVRTDAESARRLLLHLSEIFQRALRSGQFILLRDELSYVEAYLALEKARLGERLKDEWAIEDEALLDHDVPTLILQPLVENAIIHAVAVKPEGGTVRIGVSQTTGNLVLRVEDDGPGVDPVTLAALAGPSPAGNTSAGLHNVDGRLRALYGEDFGLVIESQEGLGTQVEIRIPIGG